MLEPAALQTVLAGAWRRESPWHGEEHWRCVTASALALADAVAGVDRSVAFCFGLLHDTRRENEHHDPCHGPRAAAYARDLHAAGVLPLGREALDLLCRAIELHADGLVSGDPTTGVCWDADRLHLPRVGIVPDERLLSTGSSRGEARLAAAARLREAPPAWPALAALA